MDFKTYCMDALKNQDEKIDLDFVEKFAFSFASKDPFPIPVETLVEWKVDYQKSDALKRIEKNFIKDRDFKVAFLKSTGGRPAKQIMLSVKCFKSLCAQAQNEMGKKTLDFYFALEGLWMRYMAEQYEEHKKEKEELEAKLSDEQKARRNAENKYKRAYGREHPHKFGTKGPSFYIISYNGDVKFGISGVARRDMKICSKCLSQDSDPDMTDVSIDQRFSVHRTLWPKLRVEFIAHTKHAVWLETSIKYAYRSKMSELGKNHELIRGVPAAEIVKTSQSFLDLLDISNEESCFLIEPNIHLYNTGLDEEENLIESDEKVIEIDLGTVEINHLEITRVEIQEILDKLSKMSINQLKDTSRRFGLPLPTTKYKLIKSIKNALTDALNNDSEDEADDLDETIPEFDQDNLPRGLRLLYDNGQIEGIKMSAYVGGNTYSTVFRDQRDELEERFKLAWTMRQDIIREYKLTGSVNWESYQRRQIVRQKICLECGKEVSKTSSLCYECANKSDIRKPNKETLLAVLREHKGNLSAVGRHYKKTDVAVRKWLLLYGFTRDQIKERSFL